MQKETSRDRRHHMENYIPPEGGPTSLENLLLIKRRTRVFFRIKKKEMTILRFVAASLPYISFSFVYPRVDYDSRVHGSAAVRFKKSQNIYISEGK